MLITLNNILKHPTFQTAEILAGKSGLFRRVKRVSVFDCPFREEILDNKTIEEGDFFISCLTQFSENSDEIDRFMDTLIRGRCSGLCVVSNDNVKVLNQRIFDKCNENDFPLIYLEEDIPYALIMDAINKFIAIENLNAISLLKLDKIQYDKISSREKLETLYSINPNIEKFVQVVSIRGEMLSELTQAELHSLYLNKREDIFVNSQSKKILILSSPEQKQLKNKTDAAKEVIKRHFADGILGISRIYPRKEIDKALEEAKNALVSAETFGNSEQEYNPLSVMQLLIVMRNSEELNSFYNAYLSVIKKNVSEEGLEELLKTVEEYVKAKGDFKVAAQKMQQHENTIRYRINKVKSYLGMEDDTITFTETISIAVKIGLILGE